MRRIHHSATAACAVNASANDATDAALLRRLGGLPSTAQRFERFERPEPLTAREADVLRLLTGGYSNREIADALHLREGTVKNHVSSVLDTLGVRDRTRAALRGIELGYAPRRT